MVVTRLFKLNLLLFLRETIDEFSDLKQTSKRILLVVHFVVAINTDILCFFAKNTSVRTSLLAKCLNLYF